MGFDPYNSIQTFDWRQNAWSLILIFDSFFLNLYTKRDSRQYGRIFRHTFFFGKSLTGGAGFLLDSCKVCETNRQAPRAMLVSNPAAAKGGGHGLDQIRSALRKGPPMTLCLCRRSAAEYLREAGARGWRLAPLRRRSLPRLVPCASEVERLRNESGGFLTDPVHLLVADASERRLVKDALCHAAPARTLPRFVLETPSGLLVEGPGLCLLHAACELPLSCVAELAYEFCGNYRLRSDSRGFADCDPLTSRLELVRFAEAIGNAKGSRRLGRALAYVRDGSRSPMETVIVLLLCLPPRLGGYGLPMPLLNHRVDVGRNGRKTSSNKYYVCDAFWPEAWLDVEYDSDLAHTGPLRIAKDAKRRNGLASLGVTVITVTKEQAFNCDEMDRIAHAVAKKLRWRLHVGGSEWVKARAGLRRELLFHGNVQVA